ncbi:MAG: DUF362 domain-containing protein [Desulfobulbus sp.]|jgi:uncharacterized protein (DUF362 family)
MDLIDTHVVLRAQPDYARPGLDAAVDALLDAQLGGRNLRGSRVLVKPNLLTAVRERPVCTDARLLLAVTDWLQARGARVRVGDSPSFGSARSVLRAIGALAELCRRGVEVVEFRRGRRVVLPCGLEVGIAEAALDCDLLVNLPKVKAHGQMRVTLAIKNYFGCVAGFRKPWYHMVHGGGGGVEFARLLVELLTMLPPGCTLADGIEAMHESGPIHGVAYPLGLLAGGINPVAVETALLAVLGVDPRQSPLWLAAERAGYAGTRVQELIFSGPTPGELAVRDFRVPGELSPVRFRPLRFVGSSLRRVLLRLRGR